MNSQDSQGLFPRKAVLPYILLALALNGNIGCAAEEYPSDYALTEPVALTSGPGKNEDPCLLRAKDGTIYMAWFSDRGGNPDIYLMATKGGKKWSEPVAIVRGGGMHNFYPSMAQTRDGTFHLTWFRIDVKRRVFSVWYANSKDAKTWSEPRAMTPLEKDFNWVPTIAAADNNVWIAWASGRTGNKDVFVMQSKDAGKTWQEPIRVTSHAFHDDLPNIARKPDGTLIVVWTRYKPGKGDYLSETADIYYTTSKDGKTWSDPVAVTQNDYTDTIPEIYANLRGSEFFAVWCSTKGTFDLPLSDLKAPPKHLLSSKVGGYSLRLVPLTDEDYLVVWVKKVNGNLHIYSCQMRKDLMTRWAKDVAPGSAWPEYPRPQMVRHEWQNLNGLWDYAITPRRQERADQFQGKILVPFAVQSALSGVKKTLTPEDRLWYRRTFHVPEKWSDNRILLHFGAVDWQAVVWVNGREVGRHEGGYDPFTFDITDALKKGSDQEVVVAVWDPTDQGQIPHGKQKLKAGGIFYTAVSGIWQTAWLEPVPKAHIAGLKITPDLDANSVRVIVNGEGAATDDTVLVAVKDGGKTVATGKGSVGREIAIPIENPKLWAPGSPHLYDLSVKLERGTADLDAVDSYFGMRKIEVKKDEKGLNRLFLNGKPLFQMGLLDQGWWPDGLYTAPTDEALRFDIEETLRMGFNMARKHVKVEPERWYYWADKLGLLVWQDMPSGDIQHKPGQLLSLADVRGPESKAIYEREYKAMIESHSNHPSIVMWVPFNEGWGQFDTERIAKWTKQLDPTRPVNNASGWYDRGAGDVKDMHDYPGPNMPEPEANRAVVLGEFGGLGVPVEGHLWRHYWGGWTNMKDTAELTECYGALIKALGPMVARGLAAAVYTQTTDCEGEINGLLTYDRAVNKIGAEVLAKLHAPLYAIPSDPTAPKPPPPAMPKRKPPKKAAGKKSK